MVISVRYTSSFPWSSYQIYHCSQEKACRIEEMHYIKCRVIYDPKSFFNIRVGLQNSQRKFSGAVQCNIFFWDWICDRRFIYALNKIQGPLFIEIPYEYVWKMYAPTFRVNFHSWLFIDMQHRKSIPASMYGRCRNTRGKFQEFQELKKVRVCKYVDLLDKPC